MEILKVFQAKSTPAVTVLVENAITNSPAGPVGPVGHERVEKQAAGIFPHVPIRW